MLLLAESVWYDIVFALIWQSGWDSDARALARGEEGWGKKELLAPAPLDTIKPPLTNGNHGNLILEPSVVTNGIKPSNLILELTDPFSDKGLEEEDDVDSVILPTKVVIAPEGAR